MNGRKGCLLIIAIPIAILVTLLLFSEWAWGGYVKTSLDAQYMPTAEFLLDNPAPAPAFLTVYPPPGSTIRSKDTITASIPVLPEAPLGDKNEIIRWTHLYINQQRMSHGNFGVALSSGLDSNVPGYVREIAQFIFSPDLESGLHLLEIRVGNSITALFNPTEAYSYTWAYRVE